MELSGTKIRPTKGLSKIDHHWLDVRRGFTAMQRFAGYRGTSGLGQSVRRRRIYEFTAEVFYPPLTAPAVNPATIWRCANTVRSNTGKVTISADAARGPQLNWSNEIML